MSLNETKELPSFILMLSFKIAMLENERRELKQEVRVFKSKSMQNETQFDRIENQLNLHRSREQVVSDLLRIIDSALDPTESQTHSFRKN